MTSYLVTIETTFHQTCPKDMPTAAEKRKVLAKNRLRKIQGKPYGVGVALHPPPLVRPKVKHILSLSALKATEGILPENATKGNLFSVTFPTILSGHKYMLFCKQLVTVYSCSN